jgi:hypothetical protein
MIEALKTMRGLRKSLSLYFILFLRKSLLFNTLCLWITAFVSYLVINYHIFLVIFAPSS